MFNKYVLLIVRSDLKMIVRSDLKMIVAVNWLIIILLNTVNNCQTVYVYILVRLMRMTLNWVPTIPPGGGRNRLAEKSWAKFRRSFWASGKVIEAWFGGQKAGNREISCGNCSFARWHALRARERVSEKTRFLPYGFLGFWPKITVFFGVFENFFSNAGQTLPRDYTPPKKKHFRKKIFWKKFRKKIFKNFFEKNKKIFFR